ncbi:lanthionine synthetase C family protein [Kitasatospora cineracea]|uniref:Lanthionine synthetase-like protein n=1 Tax=Kitasatospora cineracea TaxID=88074 RepID=A0A8G1UH59_9ACTN|nr:lanthionine synthetase C family protein [Kitasatospora cineracea]ROR42959.1 lanthionine synthetase-like protein [Kitasatospora cineracea]
MTAELLAPPAEVSAQWGQSLAKGGLATALLHIERATTGRGDWEAAHEWITACVRQPVNSFSGAGVFYGAPAVAHVLHLAALHGPRVYERPRMGLNAAVEDIVRKRLAAAHHRMDAGQRPAFHEFDLLSGLTGLGAHLRVRGEQELLREVLGYLVRLTVPVHGRSGWWTHLAPSGEPDERYPGGHGNFGIAHGIPGPLALLALAHLDGTRVPGQLEAIERILDWLDAWQQNGAARAWWPEALTAAEADQGETRQSKPLRPSWCYGTPGIATALHHAARATGDPARARTAEAAFLDALEDPDQVHSLTDETVCHGTAGVRLAARRFAERTDHTTGMRILAAASTLPTPVPAATGQGLLEGTAGISLARCSLAAETPGTGWDALLLLV